MLYLDIFDRCSVEDGFEGYSRLLKELCDLLRVVDANEVLCPFDIRKEFHCATYISCRITGRPKQSNKERRLVTVIAAHLMECFLGAFHTTPVPFCFDAVFD